MSDLVTVRVPVRKSSKRRACLRRARVCSSAKLCWLGSLPFQCAGMASERLCACAQFLREQGLFESREELQQREDVLGRLAAVAVEWVRKVTRALALGDDFAEMSRATIQTFGSYRLGVHGPGAAFRV